MTEEIAEEDLRSSSEEFETAVTGDGAAVENGDDDGLSKFEKALLLGLGAVVVGSVLKNGDKVLSRSGDRVVVEDPNGDLRVLKDDDALIRRAGDQVATETFDDGSSRSIVTKPDGSKIITVRGRDGTVLRRVNIDAQGNEYVLIDDLAREERVVVTELPPVKQSFAAVGTQDEAALRAALEAEMNAGQDRRFSLRQVRDIKQVRALAPELELDAVRFDSGSAAIRPEQARSLAKIGRTLSDLVAADPRTVILIEGHTDAVGSATYNLALSDRRAETVALALTEYFDVPPENMITQGYGESALKVLTLSDEVRNRRAVVRNITNLLR
ncbi:OmpA family protein [Sulfitobacter pacificus]|uniref:OmpA family protein n=1 Tax=Sulfitobacter pacificus TaxID=1499314 RepID=UPI00361DE10F